MLLVFTIIKITEILSVKALRALERGIALMADEAACGACGCRSFEIVNYSDLELAGTVRIDAAGDVIAVEGILFCVGCNEVFDPDVAADPQGATRVAPGQRPDLRLIPGG